MTEKEGSEDSLEELTEWWHLPSMVEFLDHLAAASLAVVLSQEGGKTKAAKYRANVKNIYDAAVAVAEGQGTTEATVRKIFAEHSINPEKGTSSLDNQKLELQMQHLHVFRERIQQLLQEEEDQ